MDHFAGLDVSVKDTSVCIVVSTGKIRPEHAAFDAVVMAQGSGDADRQAPRHETGDCRAGATVGGDHAPIYGPTARCKGIRTEWSFWSALIYPASRGSSCSGPSWLSAHT